VTVFLAAIGDNVCTHGDWFDNYDHVEIFPLFKDMMNVMTF